MGRPLGRESFQRSPRKVTADSGQEQAVTSLILRRISNIKEDCRGGNQIPNWDQMLDQAPAGDLKLIISAISDAGRREPADFPENDISHDVPGVYNPAECAVTHPAENHPDDPGGDARSPPDAGSAPTRRQAADPP